ncbi:hypothetical protein BKA66DRAFT_417423 [Pyrenochaeta sp. MPI-SDFR-AT-0127]|nr:hypothetical protein BKA66DRAFT_417423 [Pyrenochaeta sp. MPI-SDFR-AT-0127]
MFTKAAIGLLAVPFFADFSAATTIPEVFPRESSSGAARACARLKATFPDNYIDATSSNYTTEKDVNWSTNCRLPAACFFLPTSTEIVAQGLSIVTKANAKFAVRNGGHNPNIKFASIDGGVLFDMNRLKSLTLNSDKTIMHVGAGNRGGEVQGLADSAGKSAVTGIDMDPGISGLTLGGGYTHFSQLNGLVTDNVANFEVVLSNSSIVNANATHNTDLYRALRGGGNNFGIVTRFDLRASPIYNIWYSLFLLDPKEYTEIIPAIVKVQNSMEKDPKANVEVLVSAKGVQIALFYAEPESAKPEIFAPLLAFTPMLVVAPPTNGTVYEIMKDMSSPKEPLVRMVQSIIYKPSTEFYLAQVKELLKVTPPGEELDLVLAIKPMGSRVASAGTKQAGGVPNSLNLPSIPQTWGSILVQYKEDKDKDLMTKKLRDLDAWMTSNARRSNLLLPNLFANDAGSSQNVMASYGAESLANLKSVSRKYDPAQVFQKLQVGGFLVSKA